MRDLIKPYAAVLGGIALGFSVVAVMGVHAITARLEHAAAMQCRQQDWPAAKHIAMTEWCREFEATRAIYGRY